MTRPVFKFLALGALALPLLAAAYGGWAVITIDQLPQDSHYTDQATRR